MSEKFDVLAAAVAAVSGHVSALEAAVAANTANDAALKAALDAAVAANIVLTAENEALKAAAPSSADLAVVDSAVATLSALPIFALTQAIADSNAVNAPTN